MRKNEARGEIVMQAIDMRTLVEDMTGLLEASASRKAELKFDLASESFFFEGDPTRVRLIIMNLVKNVADSVKGDEAIIELGVGKKFCDSSYFNRQLLREDPREGDYVFFQVSDKSIGKDPAGEEWERDPSLTSKFMEGIPSMAIVKGIIHAHGGTITLEKKPGGEASIMVLFPAMEMEAGKIEKRESPGEETSPDGCKTVLLVDDEAMVRRVAKAMLELIGFNVLTAADGKEAVETFQRCSEAIRCVILNMTMPRMGGERCFKELVHIDPSVNVLVASGYAEDQVLPLFTDAAPAGFIQKPFNLNEFPSRVKEVVDGGGMSALLN